MKKTDMKDERIQRTVNSNAAKGFFIWWALMSISLVYRTLFLKQHPSQWWDIAAIWFVGIYFVFIAHATKGVFDHNFKKYWLTLGIGTVTVVVTVNTALFFIMGQINSIAEAGRFVGESLIGAVASVGLVIAVAYLLNRRWRRKSGIEEENENTDPLMNRSE